jgi:uncharacterized membrane protein
MNKLKKENVIFGTEFFGSIAIGMILIAIGYLLLGLIIALVGCLMSGIYYRKAKGAELSDEREEFINGKAGTLTFRITFPVFGLVFAVISALSIDVPASKVLGPLFAFYAIAHVVSYHYYGRRYR